MSKVISMIMIFLTLITMSNVMNKNNNLVTVEGEFVREFEAYSITTETTDKMYLFKSYDGTTTWALEEEEIGFVPCLGETYTLTYDNKGTTAENKPCDCLEEYECECELYDDEVVKVER